MILCYSSRQKPRMTLIWEASCSMRQKQMQRPTPTYGLKLRQYYVRFGGRIERQKGESKSTKRWTKSTNLDTEVSQRLSHQWKTIHGMDLEPLKHVADVEFSIHVGPTKLKWTVLAICGINSFVWTSLFALNGTGCTQPFIDWRYHGRGIPIEPPASQNIRGRRYGGRNVWSTERLVIWI